MMAPLVRLIRSKASYERQPSIIENDNLILVFIFTILAWITFQYRRPFFSICDLRRPFRPLPSYRHTEYLRLVMFEPSSSSSSSSNIFYYSVWVCHYKYINYNNSFTCAPWAYHTLCLSVSMIWWDKSIKLCRINRLD